MQPRSPGLAERRRATTRGVRAGTGQRALGDERDDDAREHEQNDEEPDDHDEPEVRGDPARKRARDPFRVRASRRRRYRRRTRAGGRVRPRAGRTGGAAGEEPEEPERPEPPGQSPGFAHERLVLHRSPSSMAHTSTLPAQQLDQGVADRGRAQCTSMRRAPALARVWRSRLSWFLATRSTVSTASEVTLLCRGF